MTGPSGISVTSFSVTRTLGCSLRTFVICSEKSVRSTAKALPAGTLVSSAVFKIKESKIRSSSFKIPTALFKALERRELEQTSSAKFPV